MKICVMGTGYVGLVTSACLSDSGHTVYGFDIDRDKIKMLNEGRVPIYEPSLPEMIERNIRAKRLFFTSDPKEAMEGAEVIYITVGTPVKRDRTPDMRYVWSAVKTIIEHGDDSAIVVMKSTVPVGTSDEIERRFKRAGKNFRVISNPEFLKEGNAVEDFLKPDRIIIGGNDESAIAVMKKIYEPFVRSGNPILIMDRRSAEMVKYASNAMLALRVSFINEIANICERVGADVEMVRRGVGADKRIGSRYLFPGTGYGGSCFPKDLSALIHIAVSSGYRPRILKAIERVNEEQKKVLVKKAVIHFNGNLKGKRFAIWGLSFKPNTDDVRDAPSITVIRELLKRGAHVVAYDPVAIENAKKVLPSSVKFAKDMYESAKGSDGIFLITEWYEFRFPDFEYLSKIMRRKIVFDGRNLYEISELKKYGFTYYGIGRLA